MTRSPGESAAKPQSGRSLEVPRGERADRRAYYLGQFLSSAPAPLEFMIPKFLGVIDALDQAHKRKEKHRNLSPQTIRFTEGGKAEVPTASARPAAATVVFGSPKYGTPETLEQGEGSEGCEPNDSYALGFMFYEILLGRKLFAAEFHDVYQQGEFAWLIWHANKSLRAKPLCELIEGFPHALSVLIDGMMMKDPAARTKDLRAVRNILANALQVTTIYSVPAPNMGLTSSPTDDASIHLVASYLLTYICHLSNGRAVQTLRTWIPPVAQQTIRAVVLGVSSRVKSTGVKLSRSLILYISKLKKECL